VSTNGLFAGVYVAYYHWEERQAILVGAQTYRKLGRLHQQAEQTQAQD